MSIALNQGMRQSLYSIQNTSILLQETGTRLSTGKKVNSVLDDPISYYKAKAHRDRAADLMSRKDEMGEAVQTIKSATTGIESIEDLVESAKSLAQSAQSADTSAEVHDLEGQFNTLLTQITELSEDSGYRGINLLADDDVTAKFDEKGDSKVKVEGFDSTASGLSLGTLNTGDWDTATNIETSLGELDSAKTTLRSEAKGLSTNLGTIKIRQNFTDSMMRTLNDGADNLTNADMDEEAAKYLALQTQNTLARSTLSMASQNAQSILRLF